MREQNMDVQGAIALIVLLVVVWLVWDIIPRARRNAARRRAAARRAAMLRHPAGKGRA